MSGIQLTPTRCVVTVSFLFFLSFYFCDSVFFFVFFFYSLFFLLFLTTSLVLGEEGIGGLDV